MDEFAAIGIKMPTDDLERGITKLEELSRQGPKVESSMKGIESGAKRVAKSLAELGVGSGAGLDKVGAAGQKAAAGVQAVGSATRTAVTDTESLRRSLSSLTGEEERFVKSLEKQYNAMSMGRGDFEAYIAVQKGMGTGAQEVARAIGNKIDALKTEQAELAKSKSAMDEVIAGAKNLALSLAGGALFKKFITETVNAQQEQAQLAAVLKSTGEAAGWSQQKLNDMASAMSRSSMFSSGEINQAQTRLLSYSNVVGQQFPRAMQAVVDMSSRMGMSITQSAEMIGKALDVPSEGLTALSKNGFRFTESQKALVQHFEETGQAAKAQAIILEAVESSYGGAAKAARDTLGGSLKALQDSFNDVMTGDSGSAKGMQESIESLNRTLSSEATRAGFQTVISSIAKIVEVASTGISVLGQFANAASLSGKVAQHGQYERQFDFAKGQLDRLQPRLRLDPNNEELKAEAKELRDAMTRAHKAMQDATAGIASVAGVGSPAIDAPAVIASTKALEGQGIVLGKTAEWIRSYGTAVEKADLAVKEWRKQLGDGLTADMEAQIRAGFKEKGAKGAGQQEKAISDIRARILAEEELIKRIQEHGVAAQGLSESDKLVGKLQEEIAGTTNKRTKASLEGQLAEALVWQETQKHRTELEKLAKTQDEGEKSYRKYIDSLYKSADVLGDMADKQNAANASFGKSKVAIAEMAAEQAKLAFLNAKDMGPWTPEQIAALKALTDQHDKYVKSLREAEFLSANRKYDDAIKAAKNELELQQYGMSLLGQEELTRNKLIAARKAEIKLAKELLDIEKQYKGRTDDESVKQRTELESKARIQAEEELQGELSRIQNQYITEQVNKYGDIFRQGFADFVNNGTDGLKAFGKSLKTTILTSVADALYKAFAQKFVVNVVASLSGGGGWVDSLLGLVGMAGGSSGGGSNAMSLFSNGKTAYDLYTGNGVYGQAWNYVSGLWGGGSAGASSVYSLGTGASGYGMTAPSSGYFAGVNTGGGSAAGAGWGAAAAMAIPFIAAYLGGMFKEEKMVGQGLTGDLGGDMYGYQLMRESGGLFDGPNYRYLVAEKEVAEAKARIAELQTGKPYADLGEKGDALRERELQRLYSRLDMLEREYSGAIDGSHGPIKIIQDAFQGMREATASKADTLGLNGDAIRAMKVALGVDEIHPDTGGKGLQLTGLTQEEAAAKIQEALNQANEELARSVLGSWQEQTREIPRVIFDQVSLGDMGGDTEQFGRVGREVTETITEQVFVMSEFVREGETAVQALDRMSGSLVGVNNVFELLGATLVDASLAGGDWASTLVEAIGGMDALTAAAGSYFDLYYSDAEKQAFAADRANKGMEGKGLDLRVGDADAKQKYRAMVDKAIADKDEELLAWLLQFGDDFAAGVDAFTSGLEQAASAMQEQLAEMARIREETLSTIGLSMDGLVDGFIQEINEGRGAQAGGWLADQIAFGFEEAVYQQGVTAILGSMIDGMITPMINAAMTGASVADAVSGAAIDNMIANANAAMQALNTLLGSEEFKAGMDKLKVTITGLGNSIGASIPPMRNYHAAVSNAGSAYDGAAKAAEDAAKAAQKLTDEWRKLIDSMSNEMDRLRGELLGGSQDQGMAYYESMFAIKTAQARAGDQDAAAELPSIIKALEELARGNASSQADVLLKQAEWLASLTDTRNFLAGKYGVDISSRQGAEVAATTTGRVIQTSGNTAVLNALQSSSDSPAIVAELRALRIALEKYDDNRKAEANASVPAVQEVQKTLRQWNREGTPPVREDA